VSENETTTAARPPQGIALRYMQTGNAALDHLASGPHLTVPRVDPASLGEAPFLALPIEGQPGKIRVRQFTPEMAADILTRDAIPGRQQGIRLASDPEVAAHHAEEAERASGMRAERERLARAAAERYLADQRHNEETMAKLRAAQGKGGP
jgi:hypothetical protein